jgi:biotin transporter BioY
MRPAVLAAFVEPSPLPLVGLVLLGFLVGVTGHVYRSKSGILTGIGLILLGTIGLPLALYFSDR